MDELVFFFCFFFSLNKLNVFFNEEKEQNSIKMHFCVYFLKTVDSYALDLIVECQ